LTHIIYLAVFFQLKKTKIVGINKEVNTCLHQDCDKSSVEWSYLIKKHAFSLSQWKCNAEPQPDRLVLELPTPEGWKAELT